MLIKNIFYFGFIDKKNKGNVDNGMKKCWNKCIYVNLFDMFYLNIKKINKKLYLCFLYIIFSFFFKNIFMWKWYSGRCMFNLYISFVFDNW